MYVLNITTQISQVDETTLDLHFMTLNAQESAAAFIAASTADNTLRSYRSALAYWSAWLQLGYGHASLLYVSHFFIAIKSNQCYMQ